MAILTTEAQLEQVQTAITAVLTGNQSYTLDGRQVSRANLDALQRREEQLLRRYNSEQGNRPVLTAVALGGAGYE